MFFITWVDVWVREASLNFLMSFYRRKIQVEDICSFTPSFDQVQRHDESTSAEWGRLENLETEHLRWRTPMGRTVYLPLKQKQTHHPCIGKYTSPRDPMGMTVWLGFFLWYPCYKKNIIPWRSWKERHEFMDFHQTFGPERKDPRKGGMETPTRRS